MLKFFKIPFGLDGDKTAIPNIDPGDGRVSYQTGWGQRYSLPVTDPQTLKIPRDQSNELYFDITNAVGEIQRYGLPDFITAELNGGTAFAYSKGAMCRLDEKNWVSTENDNETIPGEEGALWVELTAGGGSVSSVGMRAPSSGITVTGSPITTSGMFVLALSDDLAAIEGLTTTGYAVRTGDSTWSTVEEIPYDDLSDPPTALSDFTNDVGFVTASTAPVTSVAGQTGAVSLDVEDVAGAAPATLTINTYTVNTIASMDDATAVVRMNAGAGNTYTIPPNSDVAFPPGTQIAVYQYGAGVTSIVEGTGVTINTAAATMDLRAQYSGCTLLKVDTNEWLLIGDMATA